MTRKILLLIWCCLLSACASGQYGNLNNIKKAEMRQDFAPFSEKQNTLPFEWQKVRHVEIGYNLRAGYLGENKYYWLRLIIKNNGEQAFKVAPKVRVYDNTNMVVKMVDYISFVKYAAMLADVEIPPVAIQNVSSTYQAPDSYSHSGTIFSSSGNIYNYRGTTTSTYSGNTFESSFKSAFAQGMAQGAAMAPVYEAKHTRAAGEVALNWANTHWLKNEYYLEPNTSVGGVLVFAAPTAIPLRVEIEVNGSKFSFITASEITN